MLRACGYHRVVTGETYKYYRIEVNDANSDVSFTVTPRGGANPVLYASPAPNDTPDIVLPTEADHVWAGSEFGGNVIMIPHTDSHACTGCSYVLAVHAARNTSFYVVAMISSNEGVHVTELIDGQSLLSACDTAEFQYFSLSVRDNEYHTAQFSATPQTGDLTMFLTNL